METSTRAASVTRKEREEIEKYCRLHPDAAKAWWLPKLLATIDGLESELEKKGRDAAFWAQAAANGIQNNARLKAQRDEAEHNEANTLLYLRNLVAAEDSPALGMYRSAVDAAREYLDECEPEWTKLQRETPGEKRRRSAEMGDMLRKALENLSRYQQGAGGSMTQGSFTLVPNGLLMAIDKALAETEESDR